MKKIVVPLLLVAVSVIVVAGFVLFRGWELLSKPIGQILVCEVVSDPNAGPAPSVENVVKGMDRRINPGLTHRARIRPLDAKRFEVAIYGRDPREADHVEGLLLSQGTLEFRILANPADHKAIIDQALKSDAREVQNDAGKFLARWVPVMPNQEKSFSGYPDIVSRTGAKDGKSTLEILVVQDQLNVNGSYLSQVSRGVDQMGRPSVLFQFGRKGAILFEGLTSQNLPDDVSGRSRKLGIILDGRLHSAPAIRSVIRDRGEITGNFTVQEVVDLVDVLNAGPIGVGIRIVQRKIPAEK